MTRPVTKKRPGKAQNRRVQRPERVRAARDGVFRVRVSEGEKTRFEAAAAAKGQTLSAWVRLVLLEVAANPALVNVTRASVRHTPPARPAALVRSFDPDEPAGSTPSAPS